MMSSAIASQMTEMIMNSMERLSTPMVNYFAGEMMQRLIATTMLSNIAGQLTLHAIASQMITGEISQAISGIMITVPIASHMMGTERKMGRIISEKES